MSMTMQKHTITAFYDTRDYANSAATRLKQFGVPASDVTFRRRTPGTNSACGQETSTPSRKDRAFGRRWKRCSAAPKINIPTRKACVAAASC